MPRPKRKTALPSEIGTSILLNKEILETILVTQYADQRWIDILSMIRRVNSTWNHVARYIYPEFTIHSFREPIQEGEETWRATFSRDKENAHARIQNRREQTDTVFSHAASNALKFFQTYPATLNILVEAMNTLQGRTPPLNSEDDVLGWKLFGSDTHANILYSALSRHTLRPTPYAAQDLPSQIREHIAATPRATRVLVLGNRILNTLVKFNHCCPSAISTLHDSLRVLTAGRAPCKKEKQDWSYTQQTAFLLSMNLRGMDREDLIKLGEQGLDALLNFVQTHLIAQGRRWMRKRAYAAWREVQEPFTTTLYDIITDLLRIQYRQDTLHQTGMLQAIADSIVDITQCDTTTVHGLSILSCLNLGSQSSPLDGVILKVLESKWNGNLLTPKVWTQGHLQRKTLHAAGGNYSPDETARLLLLTYEVMHAHCPHSSPAHVCRLTGQQRTARDSFLRTGSHWIRDLAINEMSNLSHIGLLCTELLLKTLTHMQDEPITAGNCIHTLCLLSSTAETAGKIRDLTGGDIIMKLLPQQFPEKRGEATPQETLTLYNKNLRLTLRTLRHFTGPDLNLLHCPRLDTEANLRRVFDTLQVWMGDETSKGLTFQVLHNMSRVPDEEGDLTQQDTSRMTKTYLVLGRREEVRQAT